MDWPPFPEPKLVYLYIKIETYEKISPEQTNVTKQNDKCIIDFDLMKDR